MTINTERIITGDCFEQLSQLPESSIHMAMTSPPYWQLRDYGVEGQLGLEETADEYVSNIADVMDNVKRVLRDDGSLWLNLGDTYKDKDLQQIPARVAIECQSRGWTLRNRVTWAKPNPMPNSQKDRLTTTTEAVFHLTPEKQYYYDLDAIREPHSERTQHEMEKHEGDKFRGKVGVSPDRNDSQDNIEHAPNAASDPGGKNPGDVFEVTTKPFPDAHFAVYPPKLCAKPIKASCPPKVCVECGAPYEREVEREERGDNLGNRDDPRAALDDDVSLAQAPSDWEPPETKFKSWRQTCNCATDKTEPGIALDPFAGAGTTLLKAKELGRRFLGIELNPEYADMARARIGLDVKNPSVLRSNENQTGLGVFD